MRDASRRLVPVAFVALLAAPLTGCLFPGGSGGSDAIYTTNRGAQGRLSGGVESIAADIEEVFRFMNIEWSGRTNLRDGTEIRGYSGNDEVTIRLRPTSGRYTRIEVLVKEPAAQIGTAGDRWDRDAARFILTEIRRWRAG